MLSPFVSKAEVVVMRHSVVTSAILLVDLRRKRESKRVVEGRDSGPRYT